LNTPPQHANPTPSRFAPGPLSPHAPHPFLLHHPFVHRRWRWRYRRGVVTAIAIERRSIEDVSALSDVGRLHLGGGRCRRSAGVHCKAPHPMRRAVFSRNRARPRSWTPTAWSTTSTSGSPTPPRPPRFSLDMLRNGDGIQIIGLVPAQWRRRSRRSAIEAIADGAEVTDMVETADYPPPDTWISALGYGLRALRELPRSKVTVYADRVEVEAISDSAEQQAELAGGLQMRTAGRGRGRPRHLRAASGLLAVPVPCGSRCAGASDRQLRSRHAARAGAHHRRRAARRALGEIDCPIGLGVRAPVGPARSRRGLPRLSSWEAGPCPSATRPSR
jgi:hypothetical protein